MARRFATLGLALAAFAFLPGRAGAFERFDFDQRYFIQPGFIVKDHTLVDTPTDTFHLFYIKADETLPENQRAKALGHATSTDLVHWQFHPDVIPVVPNTWEESYVWAPHIVESLGYYFMYYTGVNRYYAQAIGLAVSADLYNWFKYPANPVYTPSTTWAAWSPTAWSNCRDPYVFQDNGVWYLLTTAHTIQLKGAISLASSPDLVNWTDLGPLLVHPGPQAWHVLESSNLHYHAGQYHLFFTEQNIGGSSYLNAPDLAGPWNYPVREPFDAGHATEVFPVDGAWKLSRHTTFTFEGAPRYTIKFDDLDWNTAGKPLIEWRDPMSDWTIWSGDAFYLQPTFWDNTAARGSDPCNFGGNSWVGTRELFTGPLQVGFPGLDAGEEPRGIVRSRTFTLTGNRISFRIGGGQAPDSLYLALYTAADGRPVLRETGEDSDAMRAVIWNVGAWRDQAVFLEMADLTMGTWGHLNVDEIIEYEASPTDVAAAEPRRDMLHANVPNPFNPSTRISFQLSLPAARARLEIFDVRGRRIRRLLDAPLVAGIHATTWDGATDDGARVASGVYTCSLALDERARLVRRMVLVR
jgi:hypothetical protein